jgi:hypothetical protein
VEKQITEKISLVVNLTKGTVTSLLGAGVVSKITASNDAFISFEGRKENDISRDWVSGDLDRVTGFVTLVWSSDPKGKIIPSSRDVLRP